jgi:amyloid beta precursor protein binding protein 1
MKLFFLYFYSLKKFFNKYQSYPLCGSIPDMISNTTNFISLKKIYNTKAEKEHKEMRELITQEIKENKYLTEEEKKCLDSLVNNLSLDKIDIVDILNKNWPQTSLFVYPDNTQEKEGKNLDVYQIDEDFQKINFVWYLLFRASDEFEKKHKRYPGDKIDDFKKDIPELFNLVKSEFEGLSNKPEIGEQLNENNVFEFCRMGRGNIPPIISIIGSMTSQEIIKLITYEFETVNNTVIYDGINVTLSNIKI